MSFQLQRVSDLGTRTPAVARTAVQGNQLMEPFPLSEELKLGVSDALCDVGLQLVQCVKVCDRIRDEVAQGRSQELGLQAGGRVITLPSVPDLEGDAGSFVQSAKLALRKVGRIFEPFFGIEFGYRFNRLLSWAKDQFPEDDLLIGCIAHHEPWVRRFLLWRNAVEHPSDRPRGRLVVQDFRSISSEDGARLAEPSWGLTGDGPVPIVGGMEATIEGILIISEDLLVEILRKHQHLLPVPVYFDEIPEAERDPECPVRLRLRFGALPE